MADTVTSQVIFNGSHRLVKKFTNLSNGTGESAVQKVDISALTGTPTLVKIIKIKYSIAGMGVKILFDRTEADDTSLILSGNGELSYKQLGGLYDPASGAGTGDILFTTIEASANDSYDITLEVEW